jgi:flagellar basal-body rod protein FlgC
MMKALTIFDVAGRAMAAQQVRLNTVASNLANAGTVAGKPEEAYRAMRPVFETVYAKTNSGRGVATVDTVDITRSDIAPEKRYQPHHPLADDNGYVFAASVDTNEELVDMLEASRQYQNNIEVLSTAKALMLKTISIGK